MKEIIKKSLIVFFVVVCASCGGDKGLKQYNQLMESELASGKRVDSIFWGIHFGMTSKQFFAYCWEMNKKGLFTDGRSNTAVSYQLDHNELKYPASMNFYPEMDQGKINKMSATFQYDGWAPWNKHLFSDSLLTDVLKLYEKWYNSGNSFIKIGKKERPVYVKIDGNRRIVIRTVDDKDVNAEYTDLLTVQKNKK